MKTIQQTFFKNMGCSLKEKEDQAILFLKENESSAITFNPDGYWLAFSGGKDSIVIKKLAQLAGVKHHAVYNQTTIDPPELIHFIKKFHSDVEWERPKKNFFVEMQTHGLPNRIVRWCCELYKERGGENHWKIIGVRAAESARRRALWKPLTPNRSGNGGMRVCPILYWEDIEVWNFIKKYNLPYCSLYDEGFKRIGCVGCPMAGKNRIKEFKRWPRFEKAYRIAASKYIDTRKGKKKRNGEDYYVSRFKNGNDWFDWWMSDNPSSAERKDECLGLFDDSI